MNEVKRGRKEKPINETLFRQVCKQWQAGEITSAQAVKDSGLPLKTFYRRAHKYGLMPTERKRAPQRVTILLSEYMQLKEAANRQSS